MLSLCAAAAVAAACAAPAPDPAQFTTRIDNPYLPMAVGSRWVYRETEGRHTQRVVVTVTDRTRRVAGVTTRVVRDVVTENGRRVEDTDDWFAQHRDGSVWYFGEDTTEFERGRPVSTAGSWEAGVRGAEAGIAMPAQPAVGMEYRQEFAKGRAEDAARVLSLDEQAEVPFGRFRGALLTKDFTPLEPRVLEYKLYARGIGPVLVLAASGGSGREELVSFRRGRR
jgi:hypothetical protein